MPDDKALGPGAVLQTPVSADFRAEYGIPDDYPVASTVTEEATVTAPAPTPVPVLTFGDVSSDTPVDTTASDAGSVK